MEESTIVMPESCVISGIVSTNNSSDECQNTTPVTLGTSTKESNAILKGEKDRLQHVNMGFAISCPIAPPTSDIPLWYTFFNRHHHAMVIFLLITTLQIESNSDYYHITLFLC